MTSTSLVLLDTNILVHLIRSSAIGRKADETLSLSTRTDRPVISTVTVGEILSLARKLGWGAAKTEALDQLVHQLVIVHLHQGDTLARYADIDYYCEKEVVPSRPMSQNDMWIAATASATGATLVTTDTDFDHLRHRFLSLIRIDAKTGDVVAL